MKILERLANRIGLVSQKVLEDLNNEIKSLKAKTGSWGHLFALAQEYRLFGEKVTQPYAQVVGVYNAIKAIADNVPQADLVFRDKASKKVINDDDIVVLFNKPNPFMSEEDFIQAWVGFQCLYGESFVVNIKSIGQEIGTRKLPARLWVFNPKKFTEVIKYDSIEMFDIEGWRYMDKGIVFPKEDVVFMRDFQPYNILRGLSPLDPLSKLIDIDWLTLMFNHTFFTNDATPGLMLGTDQVLNKDIVERLKIQFEQRHMGAENAHKVAILEAGLEPKGGAPSHKDMQFIEQKRFTREEILGVWRVPKALFNITDDLNYATFIGQMKIFWNYAIMPVMKKIQAKINAEYVLNYNPKIEAVFDYSNVIAYQEDFNSKIETATKLWNIGFTRNEINEKLQLGFDPAAWGDVWWAPFSLIPVNNAEAQLPPNIPPGAEGKQFGDLKKINIWKGFIARQASIENKMTLAIKKYFYEQRKDVLTEFDRSKTANINWNEQNDKLKEKAKQYIYMAAKEGVDHGKLLMNKKSLEDDALENRILSFITVLADKITQINDTIKRQIADSLEEGIKAGETIIELANRIRDIYNMAASRSIMIARTETVGAVNGGSLLYYETVGVIKKEWLTARDEFVRDNHKRLEGQIVLLNQNFGNGLAYPGDIKGPPEEVINCRCTILPVIERS